MKRASLVLCILFVFSSFIAVFARTFDDVPRSHWAYEAIDKLQSRGVMLGYVDGTFKGNNTLSRYALSVIVAKMLANIEQNLKSNSSQVNIEDVHLLESLAFEFADELALLGTNVNTLFDDLNSITEDVAQLKNDTKDLMAKTVEKNEKFKFNGFYRFLHEDMIKTGTPGDNVHTSGEIDLGAEINVSERITAEFCWHLYYQNYGDRDFTGASSLGGAVAAENTVDVAYIHIEDLAKGNMKFGRDFHSPGHSLVLNDFVDAVTYQRPVGDLDLTFNLIYDRQNATYAANTNDFHHIWNLNLEASRRKHQFYMGYYAQTQKDDVNAAGAVAGDTKSVSKDILEFGSKGTVCNKAYINYDLGFVHSTSKLDRFGATWVGLKDSGLMQHYALNWDNPKKRVALTVAYTAANAEFDGIIALDNNTRAYDDPETPFEDIDRIVGGLNNNFANTKNLKFQAEYFPTDSRHSLRLALDKLEERKSTANSDFMAAGLKPRTALGYNKLDTDVTTLEYRYQYKPNTRIRAGYSAADNSSSRDALNNKVADEKLLWTEIFSSF